MAQEQDLQLNPTPEESGGGKKKLIIIIVAVLLVVGIAVGVTVMLMGGDDSAPAPAETAADESAPAIDSKAMPLYFKLKPEFIVNYQVGTRQRFLQVYMEVMTRDPAMMEELETHSPMLRNSIIQLMSEQDFEELRTNEGRMKLRDLLTAEVKRLMQQETGKETIEQVLFTNYVMQ
jgi:flagellar protein FliL